MSLVVQVATSTMLADLDESLRTLLGEGLSDHGFDRIEIAFDAPSKEWSGGLSAPAVNVFLYDLRESKDHRQRTIDERRSANGAFDSRPPLVLECSYAITAWAKDVTDEHRLLSQALAILYAFPKLPLEVQPARLRDGSQRFPITTKVGHARGEGKSDFWSAVGGHYKVSLDLVCTLTVEPGVVRERGPQVRSTAVRVGESGNAKRGVVELHRFGGRLVDPAGDALANAWIALPETGRFTETDDDGEFRFERVPPGEHRCVARTSDGDEIELSVTVPGTTGDLVADTATAGKGRKPVKGRR